MSRLTLPAAPQFAGVFHSFIDVSGLVSFSGSEEDVATDDSMSMTASDVEDWACPGDYPGPPLIFSTNTAQPSMDSKLIRILTKAVKDLSLWSALEEPASGTWRGTVNAPLTRGCPVFPGAPHWANWDVAHPLFGLCCWRRRKRLQQASLFGRGGCCSFVPSISLGG